MVIIYIHWFDLMICEICLEHLSAARHFGSCLMSSSHSVPVCLFCQASGPLVLPNNSSVLSAPRTLQKTETVQCPALTLLVPEIDLSQRFLLHMVYQGDYWQEKMFQSTMAPTDYRFNVILAQ